jgi:hypothetical protein
VDEYAAENIKKIFALADKGTPPKSIATILYKEGILIPMAYLHQRTGKWGNSYDNNFPTFWRAYTIYAILKNRVYLGHMVGCKQSIKSFKNRKLQNNPEEDWIIVENTHPPLVSEKVFWHVQELLSIKKPSYVRTNENIFVGKLRCSDCGKNMGYSGTYGSASGGFICNRYRRIPKSCTSHYIRYDSLCDLVMRDIRMKAELASSYTNNFEGYLEQLTASKTDVRESNYRRDLEKAKARSDELDTIIKRLFEQNALGIIPDDRFTSMFGDYSAEQKELQTKIESLKTRLNNQKSDTENAAEFFELIQKYTNIDKLTDEIIVDVIDHIVVHQHTGKHSNRRQRVEIHYRFEAITEVTT